MIAESHYSHSVASKNVAVCSQLNCRQRATVQCSYKSPRSPECSLATLPMQVCAVSDCFTWLRSASLGTWWPSWLLAVDSHGRNGSLCSAVWRSYYDLHTCTCYTLQDSFASGEHVKGSTNWAWGALTIDMWKDSANQNIITLAVARMSDLTVRLIQGFSSMNAKRHTGTIRGHFFSFLLKLH